MASTLPAHPHLTHLKHEAKQLLRAHREGQSSACGALRNLPRFARKEDKSILAAPVALQEMQHALAIQYGFRSWNALRVHVESLRGKEDGSAQPSLVNPQSLWATIDAIDDAFFHNRPLTLQQRKEAATFIAARQGKPGSYGGMFGPVEQEESKGLRVFTGESVNSWAGSAHILGHETCRTLLQLDVRTAGVQPALDRAEERFLADLPKHLKPAGSADGYRFPGILCCPKCTCSVWRHLQARGGAQEQAVIEAGLKLMKTYRDTEGAWRVWPLRYSLLALSEMRTPAAIAEMKYAARRCELELAKRLSKTSVHSQRWRVVLERVLSLV
jgi:hypothetical protein